MKYDYEMKSRCLDFTKENAKKLGRNLNSQREFLNHLVFLLDYDLIDEQTLLSCIEMVNKYLPGKELILVITYW
jgi:hypothetical protein